MIDYAYLGRVQPYHYALVAHPERDTSSVLAEIGPDGKITRAAPLGLRVRPGRVAHPGLTASECYDALTQQGWATKWTGLDFENFAKPDPDLPPSAWSLDKCPCPQAGRGFHLIP